MTDGATDVCVNSVVWLDPLLATSKITVAVIASAASSTTSVSPTVTTGELRRGGGYGGGGGGGGGGAYATGGGAGAAYIRVEAGVRDPSGRRGAWGIGGTCAPNVSPDRSSPRVRTRPPVAVELEATPDARGGRRASGEGAEGAGEGGSNSAPQRRQYLPRTGLASHCGQLSVRTPMIQGLGERLAGDPHVSRWARRWRRPPAGSTVRARTSHSSPRRRRPSQLRLHTPSRRRFRG